MRRLLLALIAVAGCLAQAATEVDATDRFEFHSDPWINLHHFLYQWVREDLGQVRGRPPIPERADVAGLSDSERETWNDAVKFYRDSFGRKWHLDLENLRLNRDLRKLGGDLFAQAPGVLGRAMLIYRKYWWAKHDEGNRAWIDRLVPLVRRHEAGFVQLTQRAYGAKWLGTPFRVDVSAYFNMRAGYTSNEGNVILYSKDPGSQDIYALEMLFHEIQHAELVGDWVASESSLAPAFRAARAKLPENLWHALIFATAGEFVRSVVPGHVPYWIQQGLDKQDGWSDLAPVIDKYWLPFLRGEGSRDEAVAGMARAFSPN